MDFSLGDRLEELLGRVRGFMEENVYPVEAEAMQALDDEVEPGVAYPEIIVGIREKARAEGLWNLFLPGEEHGAGLTNWEYGMLCEEMGRSPVVAPMAFNCAAPDTGNMEILVEHGTDEQKRRGLEPLLNEHHRSCFSMTEPEVPGSDPTTLQARADLDEDAGEWVINGHKWFTSGAVGADFAIAMVVTDPEAHPYARASMIIVPVDTPGFDLVRSVPVMGHEKGPGHCEIRYEDCRVPVENRLGPEGAGFAIAQARLGPGRIHHCMRCIGGSQRAYEIMVNYAANRKVGGEPLGTKQFVQEFIATSKMEIDQARLFTLYTAWKMDTVGKKEAAQEISMVKVIAANLLMDVCDRSIQVMGSLGVSDDTPVASMWRNGRSLRIADGPDEVHKMVIARRELKRWAGLSVR